MKPLPATLAAGRAGAVGVAAVLLAGCSDATACYYLCAGDAYHYLFAAADAGPGAGGAGAPAAPPLSPRDAFDPRFRLACELYNAGLAKCIAAAQRVGRLDSRQQMHVPAG